MPPAPDRAPMVCPHLVPGVDLCPLVKQLFEDVQVPSTAGPETQVFCPAAKQNRQSPAAHGTLGRAPARGTGLPQFLPSHGRPQQPPSPTAYSQAGHDPSDRPSARLCGAAGGGDGRLVRQREHGHTSRSHPLTPVPVLPAPSSHEGPLPPGSGGTWELTPHRVEKPWARRLGRAC